MLLVFLLVSAVLLGALVPGAVALLRYQRKVRAVERAGRVLAECPGVTVRFTRPDLVCADGDEVRVRGRALVTPRDLDARPGRRFSAWLDVYVPVTRGVAAAADVDGLGSLVVHVVRGEVDSVEVVFACGARSSVQHFPQVALDSLG